jgi:hypothetical protein
MDIETLICSLKSEFRLAEISEGEFGSFRLMFDEALLEFSYREIGDFLHISAASGIVDTTDALLLQSILVGNLIAPNTVGIIYHLSADNQLIATCRQPLANLSFGRLLEMITEMVSSTRDWTKRLATARVLETGSRMPATSERV